jgi:hypothetical protein
VSIHENLAIDDLAILSANPAFPIIYHQQDRKDTAQYCGPACAQMVLASLNRQLHDQEALFEEIDRTPTEDNPRNWHSPPDALAKVINEHWAAHAPTRFEFCKLDSEEAVSRKLCWTIHRYGIAPIALVDRGGHWLVVTGYTASHAPASSDDTSYEIESFDVYDPGPPSILGCAPPPHHLGGDRCGTGKVGDCDRGVALRNFVYRSPHGGGSQEYWVDRLTGVERGIWTGKFVAICDPDPAPTIAERPGMRGHAPRLPKDVVLQDATTIKADFRLDQRTVRYQELAGAEVDQPLLVEREDLEDSSFYYLVPFRRGADVPVVFIVDAYTRGSHAGSISVPDGTTHFATALSREAILDRFAGQRIEVNGGRITLAADNLYSHLVWRPCAESPSPYWPFYRFDVGGPESGVKVYVRIDGELFTELHTGLGM